jgi:membrane-associated phospholipid phosphatase
MLKQLIKQHFNPYFFVPFFLWCFVGALLLMSNSSTTLFAFINGHSHPIADVVFETVNHFGEAWLLIIVGFAFFLLKPYRNIWFFVTTILCSTLPSIFTQVIKNPIAAPRPQAVYEGQDFLRLLSHWDVLRNDSFPSGHTTGAFSFMCILAFVLPVRYRFWGLLLFCLALMVGYARVYLAAHFFIDIYVGSIIGTVFSFAIATLMYYFKEQKSVSSLS